MTNFQEIHKNLLKFKDLNIEDAIRQLYQETFPNASGDDDLSSFFMLILLKRLINNVTLLEELIPRERWHIFTIEQFMFILENANTTILLTSQHGVTIEGLCQLNEDELTDVYNNLYELLMLLASEKIDFSRDLAPLDHQLRMEYLRNCRSLSSLLNHENVTFSDINGCSPEGRKLLYEFSKQAYLLLDCVKPTELTSINLDLARVLLENYEGTRSLINEELPFAEMVKRFVGLKPEETAAILKNYEISRIMLGFQFMEPKHLGEQLNLLSPSAIKKLGMCTLRWAFFQKLYPDLVTLAQDLDSLDEKRIKFLYGDDSLCLFSIAHLWKIPYVEVSNLNDELINVLKTIEAHNLFNLLHRLEGITMDDLRKHGAEICPILQIKDIDFVTIVQKLQLHPSVIRLLPIKDQMVIYSNPSSAEAKFIAKRVYSRAGLFHPVANDNPSEKETHQNTTQRNYNK